MPLHWYVVYVMSGREEKSCHLLQRVPEFIPFIPMMEYYRRDIKGIAQKPMFPGYIFIKCTDEQDLFDTKLKKLSLQYKTYFKELKYQDTSALTIDEIQYFEHMLDEHGLLRISYGKLENKKVKIVEGPLAGLENNIVKVDKHNGFAYLDLTFKKQLIKAGLLMKER